MKVKIGFHYLSRMCVTVRRSVTQDVFVPRRTVQPIKDAVVRVKITDQRAIDFDFQEVVQGCLG